MMYRKVTLILVAAIALSACSKTARNPQQQQNVSNGPVSNTPTGPSKTTTPPNTGYTDPLTDPPSVPPSQDSNPGGNYPTYKFGFDVTGDNDPNQSTAVLPGSGEIYTDNILKVRIFAEQGKQMDLPVPNNHGTDYSCVSYTIRVLGEQVTTQVLAVPGTTPSYWDTPDCQMAHQLQRTSQVFDFSNRVTSEGGERQVLIEVEANSYNFQCYPGNFAYQWWGNGYCPMQRVTNGSHVVAGELEVQVNGTSNL